MKKYSKKASILLWAVMLSLIIAITFISISTKINKNIKLSGELNDFIEEKNNINLFMNSGGINNILENKILVFDNNKEKFFSLKNKEELILFFSWSNDFNINIGIINWWWLNYKYIKNNNSISASWIINSSKTFTGELNNNNTWSLFLKNLWWNTKFLIKSDKSFETSEKNYKIVTKIWNNFFNETKNEY